MEPLKLKQIETCMSSSIFNQPSIQKREILEIQEIHFLLDFIVIESKN